jgi:hypothetical protein
MNATLNGARPSAFGLIERLNRSAATDEMHNQRDYRHD